MAGTGLGALGFLMTLKSRADGLKKQEADDTLRESFIAQFGTPGNFGTDLPPDQAGPRDPRQRPPDGGGLTANEMASIAPHFADNPALATAMANQFRAARVVQSNADRTFELQEANLEEQKASNALTREGRRLTIDAALAANSVTNAELGLRARADIDTPFAQALATKKGEQSYPLSGAGLPGRAPIPGDDAGLFNEAHTKLRTSSLVSEQIQEYASIVEESIRIGDPALRNTARAKALAAALTGAFKGEDFLNLGVLAGPDLGLVQGIVPEAWSLQTQMLSNPEAVLSALNVAGNMANDVTIQALNNTQGWEGINQDYRDRAQLAIQDQELRSAVAARGEQQEIALRQQAQVDATAAEQGRVDARAAIPGSTLENLMGTLLGHPQAAQNLIQIQQIGLNAASAQMPAAGERGRQAAGNIMESNLIQLLGAGFIGRATK